MRAGRWQRFLICMVAAVVVSQVMGCVPPPPQRPALGLRPSTPPFRWTGVGRLMDSPGWDYSPSWMADSVLGRERLWWCSDRAGPESPAGEGDVVKYSESEPGAGTWAAPRVVLSPAMEGWEGPCVCDPSVIRGQFQYQGQTYAMVMYYTASPTCTTNNAIGLAFSNDGVKWEKYGGNPVIRTAWPEGAAARYGAGQPQVYNATGGSGLWMMHVDTPAPSGIAAQYVRATTDGMRWGPLAQITQQGLPERSFGAVGWAYNSLDDHWHIIVADIREAGLPVGLNLYRIPTAQLLSGTWVKVATIPAGAAQPHQFEAGLRTGSMEGWSLVTPRLSSPSLVGRVGTTLCGGPSTMGWGRMPGGRFEQYGPPG
jgi:hypothetical protein